MEKEPRADLGERTAKHLRELRHVFEIAEETYRRFRVLLLRDPLPTGHIPVEWIPVSKN